MQGVQRNVRLACSILNQADTTSEYHTSICAQVLHRLNTRPNRGRVSDGRLSGVGTQTSRARCLTDNKGLDELIGGGPENPETRVKLNQANSILFQTASSPVSVSWLA